MQFIDTHTHLDGHEFDSDRALVVERAMAVGVSKVFVPAIDLPSVQSVLDVCRCYSGFAHPMIGLHPEEVKANFKAVLAQMKELLAPEFVAIGEVGLDFYWSREFEKEQLLAFEEQVCWSVETRLPLAIHCRKAQNELVRILRKYERDLPGGIFHCFTGNEKEAEELLSFDRFVLGVGGVLTFKKSHLPEVLSAAVPLDRVVLETDSPYMAPVPKRGERNESSFVLYVLKKLAECYGVSEKETARITSETALRIFNL